MFAGLGSKLAALCPDFQRALWVTLSWWTFWIPISRCVSYRPVNQSSCSRRTLIAPCGAWRLVVWELPRRLCLPCRRRNLWQICGCRIPGVAQTHTHRCQTCAKMLARRGHYSQCALRGAPACMQTDLGGRWLQIVAALCVCI